MLIPVPLTWVSAGPRTARALGERGRAQRVVSVVQPFDMVPQTGRGELVTLHNKGVGEEVTLPEREATPWDDRIPEWPSDDPYAKSEYPDFVEQ
jgi:hypothetical protein